MRNINKPTIAKTNEGEVQGITHQGVSIFRGIPYAKPPVESLRFQLPVPAPKRKEMLDVTTPSKIAPQVPTRAQAVFGSFEAESEEDCLTVDIFAPNQNGADRPVLIWFHGGGYFSGGGSIAWFDGQQFAREHGIIVVNVNYRLGALGYLFHPNLTRGNMGLQDQILALRWIQDNIKYFGGDASQTTLMGQSAGAHSIACMLTIPDARTLVRQAIMLSTPFGMGTLSSKETIVTAERFCEYLGIDIHHPHALEELQKTPIDKILEVQTTIMRSGKTVGNHTPPFGPTATDLLPGKNMFEQRVQEGASGKNLIIGTTKDEMNAFYKLDPNLAELDADSFPSVAEKLFGSDWKSRITNIELNKSTDYFGVLCDMQTSYYFTEGSDSLAQYTSKNGGNAWAYRFDWSPLGSDYGACHCIDLPFIFGNFHYYHDAGMLQPIDDQQEDLSAFIQGFISQFVYQGDPNKSGLPDWPPFRDSNHAKFIFDRDLSKSDR